MEMPQKPQPLNTYLDQTFTCSCGKEHYAPLKVVRIGPSALNDLPRIAREQGFQSLYLVSAWSFWRPPAPKQSSFN